MPEPWHGLNAYCVSQCSGNFPVHAVRSANGSHVQDTKYQTKTHRLQSVLVSNRRQSVKNIRPISWRNSEFTNVTVLHSWAGNRHRCDVHKLSSTSHTKVWRRNFGRNYLVGDWHENGYDTNKALNCLQEVIFSAINVYAWITDWKTNSSPFILGRHNPLALKSAVFSAINV